MRFAVFIGAKLQERMKPNEAILKPPLSDSIHLRSGERLGPADQRRNEGNNPSHLTPSLARKRLHVLKRGSR